MKFFLLSVSVFLLCIVFAGHNSVSAEPTWILWDNPITVNFHGKEERWNIIQASKSLEECQQSLEKSFIKHTHGLGKENGFAIFKREKNSVSYTYTVNFIEETGQNPTTY